MREPGDDEKPQECQGDVEPLKHHFLCTGDYRPAQKRCQGRLIEIAKDFRGVGAIAAGPADVSRGAEATPVRPTDSSAVATPLRALF
jgi:hypothetical protein